MTAPAEIMGNVTCSVCGDDTTRKYYWVNGGGPYCIECADDLSKTPNPPAKADERNQA